jgi:hypothetical protein
VKPGSTVPAAGPAPEVAPAAAGTGSPLPGAPLLAEWMDCHGPELRRHLARLLSSDDDAEAVLAELPEVIHITADAVGAVPLVHASIGVSQLR